MGLGAGAVPWVLVPELFAEDLRGVASSLAIACNWLGAFVTTLTFRSLEATSLGVQGVFWAYAFFSCVGVVFVYLCVPETSGRSLEEIQLMLAPVDAGVSTLRKVPSLTVIQESGAEEMSEESIQSG